MRQLVPNIITCCNLVCGCVAVTAAGGGNFPLSLLFIILGAAFDFVDGLAARALGVSSPIGRELDSLADCITFGLAPSTIIFAQLSAACSAFPGGAFLRALPYSAFLLAAFSAVRLAKFNTDTRQATTFIGLPTPANALFWASFLSSCGRWLRGTRPGTALTIILMLASCWLLVCEIPMFAMKFKHWGIREKGNKLKYGFMAFSAVVVVASALAGQAILSIAIVVLAYILLSCLLWIKGKAGQ